MNFQARQFLHPRFWPSWCLIGLLRLIGAAPWRVRHGLGWLLSWLFYIIPDHRKTCDTNLSLCYPELTQEQRKAFFKKNCYYSGLGIVDTPGLWYMKKDEVLRRTCLHGQEHLDHAIKKGNVILLGAHFLSLEAGTQALQSRGYVMQGMYKPPKNKLMDQYILNIRRQSHPGSELVSNREFKYYLENLRNGKISWYAPDQHFRKGTIQAPLFGVETASLTATNHMAKQGHASVLPMFGIRNSENTGFDVYILPPIENFPSEDEYQDTCRINQAIEEMIAYAPEQYLWGHKRFKKVGKELHNVYKQAKKS